MLENKDNAPVMANSRDLLVGVGSEYFLRWYESGRLKIDVGVKKNAPAEKGTDKNFLCNPGLRTGAFY